MHGGNTHAYSAPAWGSFSPTAQCRAGVVAAKQDGQFLKEVGMQQSGIRACMGRHCAVNVSRKAHCKFGHVRMHAAGSAI